ncbi:protein YqbG [Anaerovorax sp. IOR16]|uniref:protein YqbG n=1 Tax=Anaerovorax sp. IOR16 TaxID=2773458 RepID=UPI0019D13467|nr:DUF3199 family protein [Anaerovorax sp. IOR16]
MATRPWLTPEELKEYTDFEKVKNRSDGKLKTDITRAENYIIHRTNNEFPNEKFPEIPADIKLAALLVAEHYSVIASTAPQSEYQSETFKDYSYTKTTSIDKSVDDVDIDALISRYVILPTIGTVNLKLRKL